MAQMFSINKEKIYIGGAAIELPSSGLFVAADFASVSWTRINKWATSGNLGGTQVTTRQNLIDEDYEEVMKGTKSGGSMVNRFGMIDTDAGQLALYTAALSPLAYPFKIEFNDAPAVGSSPKPSVRYFAALVMEPIEVRGEANAAKMLESTLEIVKNRVRVAASAS